MINAFCFYHSDSSWSRYARSLFAAWDKIEPVSITAWDGSSRGDNPGLVKGRVSPTAPGIGIGPIEAMTSVRGSPQIATILWETSRLPSDKIKILRSMDGIWTPSTWGRQMLINNGLPAERIAVVPAGVDPTLFGSLAVARDVNRPYRFLFVGKWEVRKAVDLLIDSFVREFHAHEPVELVLHGCNPYIPKFNLSESIARVVRGRPCAPITASMPLSEDGMIALYNGCDAFVLPTRAEGWGLPVTEAMACGLPVIVTDYSAPADYLSADYAYLLPVEKMIAVRDPNFFPKRGRYGVWAQPDAVALRGLMRHVFEYPEEARAKGTRAAAEMRKRWTWDHAAAAARSALADMS